MFLQMKIFKIYQNDTQKQIFIALYVYYADKINPEIWLKLL